MSSLRRSSLAVVALVLLLSGAACSDDRDASRQPASASPKPGLARTSTRLPTPTAGPNEIRPPELVLVTAAGQSVGIVAANAWYDPETETLSGFEFGGRVVLAIDPLEWPSGNEASFELRDSPYPAGVTEIALYSYAANTAMLVNSQGTPIGTNPAFVKQTAPVAVVNLDGEPLRLSRPDERGIYIVDVTIHWPLPDEIAEGLHEQAKTEYVFVVFVQ